MCTGQLYRTRLRGQITVLVLTFFSYASFHVTRKSFSFAKVNLAYPTCDGPVHATNNTYYCPSSHCTLNTTTTTTSPLPICPSFFGDLSTTTQYLALLDTLFLSFYACGLFVAGHIVDRMDVRLALVAGMILSSLTVVGFACLALFQITVFWPYALLWSVNGLIQAAGWPANVSIMGSWFGSLDCGCLLGKNKKCGRGAIMGAWAGNASAGNIFSSLIFYLVLSYSPALSGYAPKENGNWILAMLVSAGFLAFVGVLVFFMVRLPSETGWTDSAEEVDDSDSDEETLRDASLHAPLVLDYMEGEAADAMDPDATAALLKEDDAFGGTAYASSTSAEQAISFCGALFIPGVIPYALSYACLKLANYAMFFWLPFYLSHSSAEKSGSAANIDAISSSFDYGQILGGFFAGWISDRLRTRAPVVVVMLLMSSVALLSFFVLGSPAIGLLVVMIPVTGFLLGGPANMISSAIAADLGSSVKGSGKALATVTGIIDGTGSVGAAAGQYLVYALSNCHVSCSWPPVFIMLVSCTVCAALFISRMCLKDCRKCGKTRLV